MFDDQPKQLGKREFDPLKKQSEGLFGKLLKNKDKLVPKKSLKKKFKKSKIK